MGSRLNDEERAHRIVGSVTLRKLQRKGKCNNRTCKRRDDKYAIERGEYALRFTTSVQGRTQEVGICTDCVRLLWPHIETIIGKLSLQVDQVRRELGEDVPEDDEEEIFPDGPEERAAMDEALFSELGIENGGDS